MIVSYTFRAVDMSDQQNTCGSCKALESALLEVRALALQLPKLLLSMVPDV
jgi:hypothetical protein